MKYFSAFFLSFIIFWNHALPNLGEKNIEFSHQRSPATIADSIPYDSLKVILEHAFDSDQNIRKELSEAEGNDSLFMSYLGEMSVIDRKNRENVLPVLEKYGWLRISDIGSKGSDGLFYVLQHTVDLDLFRKYLPQIKKLALENEAKMWHAALIEDRLLMYENKKQIYGSQVVTRKTKYNGEYFVWPIENPEKVNQLRQEVGLELTVEENAKRLNAIYNPEENISEED